MAKLRLEPKPEMKHEGSFATLKDIFESKLKIQESQKRKEAEKLSHEEYLEIKEELDRANRIEQAQEALPVPGIH